MFCLHIFSSPFEGALDQVYPAASWRFVIDLNTYIRCLLFMFKSTVWLCSKTHPFLIKYTAFVEKRQVSKTLPCREIIQFLKDNLIIKVAAVLWPALLPLWHRAIKGSTYCHLDGTLAIVYLSEFNAYVVTGYNGAYNVLIMNQGFRTDLSFLFNPEEKNFSIKLSFPSFRRNS